MHGMARVQRPVRILEHHLDLAAAREVDLVAERLAADLDAALPVRVQPGQAAQHRGLARTRFADEAEGFPLRYREADVVQHLVQAGAGAECKFEPIY